MKRRHWLLGAAAALAACGALPPAPPTQTPSMRDPANAQRMIVVAVTNPPQSVPLEAGSTPRGYETLPRYGAGDAARATLTQLAAQYALREVVAWPIAELRWQCVVFAIPPQASREDLLRSLLHDPRVKLAQPLQTFTTFTVPAQAPGVRGSGSPDGPLRYNDPYVGLQRGFAEIDAAEAQRWSTGAGVRLALIDGTVDATHPDLRGRVRLARDFTGVGEAPDKHGTEVAGVIAAVANNREGIVGVAPQAELLAFRACWPLDADGASAQCNSYTLAQALAAAIEARAQIINLSLGGPADPLLTQLLTYALGQGALVVGALPPDGRRDGFPLSVPGVIAVDSAGNTVRPGVIHAPGREVLTLVPGGHYDYASGSSLAAAQVSGVLALMLAREPRLTSPTAHELLARSIGPRAGASIDACVALAQLGADARCHGAALAGVAISTR
ncbi:MAG: S8 family serine peptidase [Sinobacteraceae bacterium]|nr:S8 family serine peptidase [Nevskiaceae bacterium]